MKKGFKKLAALLLAVVMVLSLTACGLDMEKVKGNWTVSTIDGKSVEDYAKSIFGDSRLSFACTFNYTVTDKQFTEKMLDENGKETSETFDISVKSNGFEVMKGKDIDRSVAYDKDADTLSFKAKVKDSTVTFVLKKGTTDTKKLYDEFIAATTGSNDSSNNTESTDSNNTTADNNTADSGVTDNNTVADNTTNNNASGNNGNNSSNNNARKKKVSRPVKDENGVIIYYEELYVDEDQLAEVLGDAIGECIIEDAVEEAVGEAVGEAIGEAIVDDAIDEAIGEGLDDGSEDGGYDDGSEDGGYDDGSEDGGYDDGSEDGGYDDGGYDDGGYDDGGYDDGGYDDGGYDDGGYDDGGYDDGGYDDGGDDWE